MPLVDWNVQTGDAVETEDGVVIGTIAGMLPGPAQSMFLSAEPYMQVTEPGQPDLFIANSEIVDVSEVKRTVYLKRGTSEINALGWTRDPRRPNLAGSPPHYVPRPRLDGRLPEAEAVKASIEIGHLVTVPPRPRSELGTWQPGEAAPRPEPGRLIRIGDRFKPGDPIPVEGQYMCTVCRFRRHSRQFREDNPDGRFPPAHHPGGLWELEDLRP
jgi:hypothetical protein